MILVSSSSCLCLIHWSQVLSREWRCSWSSADRRCSNYIWVINNFIAIRGTPYIRCLTVACGTNLIHLPNDNHGFGNRIAFMSLQCLKQNNMSFQNVENWFGLVKFYVNFGWFDPRTSQGPKPNDLKSRRLQLKKVGPLLLSCIDVNP